MFSFKGQGWFIHILKNGQLQQDMNIDVPQKMTSQNSERGHKVFGQLFILLQYQTLVHQLKVLILKTDNLTIQTSGETTIHCFYPLPDDTLGPILFGLYKFIDHVDQCFSPWDPPPRI